MVGDDLEVPGSGFGPAQADSQSTVDANGPGALSVAARRFEEERARDVKAGQLPGGCDPHECGFRPCSTAPREPSLGVSLERTFRALGLESRRGRNSGPPGRHRQPRVGWSRCAGAAAGPDLALRRRTSGEGDAGRRCGGGGQATSGPATARVVRGAGGRRGRGRAIDVGEPGAPPAGASAGSRRRGADHARSRPRRFPADAGSWHDRLTGAFGPSAPHLVIRNHPESDRHHGGAWERRHGGRSMGLVDAHGPGPVRKKCMYYMAVDDGLPGE